MLKLKNSMLWHRFLGILSPLALWIATLSVCAASDGLFYQPVVPEQLRRAAMGGEAE